MEFDFDSWAKLAKDDPAEFERRREAALRAAIAAAPAQYRSRLEGLQFRLDLERAKAPTPMAACVRMNSLMWSGFHRLRKELAQLSEGAPVEDPHGKRSADVIALRTRTRNQTSGPKT